jgi:hypothetical protein
MSAVPQQPGRTPGLGLYVPTEQPEADPPLSLGRRLGLRALEVFFTLVVLGVGLYLLPLKVMGTDLAHLPGDLDVRFNIYVLEHGWQWLHGQTAGFWNLPSCYPQPRMTAYSDNHLGTLPIYALFRAAGLDRETALQAWFLTLFVLNYLSCYLALRGLNMTALGAAAGAYGFAFSLLYAGQLDHAQLFPLFPAPLAFYFACRVCERGRGRSWAGLALLVVWQFYCSIYMGYFLCLLLAAFVPLYYTLCRPAEVRAAAPGLLWCVLAGLFLLAGARVFAHPNRLTSWLVLVVLAPFVFFPAGPRALVRWSRQVVSRLSVGQRLAWCVGIALFLGSLGVLFLPYLLVIRDRGEGGPPIAAIHGLLPRWRSWLAPAPSSWLWGRWAPDPSSLPNVLEHYLFLGLFPTVALVGAGLVLPLRLLRAFSSWSSWRLVLSAVVAVGILMVLTLYGRGSTLYDLVLLLPGTSAVRAVTRIAFLVALPAALCVAWWFTTLEIRVRPLLGRSGAVLPVLLLLILVFADQTTTPLYYRRFAKQPFQEQVRRVVEQARGTNPNLRLLLNTVPNPRHPAVLNYWEFCKLSLDGMLAAQELGVPTLNCYSSYYPPGYGGVFLRWSDVEQWRLSARKIAPETDFKDLVVVGSMRGRADSPCTSSREPLPAEAVRGRIALADAPSHWVAGVPGELVVEIGNTSGTNWPALGTTPGVLRMGFLCQWLTPDGHVVATCPGVQEWLDNDLRPGETVRDPVQVPVPAVPGRYTLKLELLQSYAVMFGTHGSGSAQYEVVVEPLPDRP